MLCVNNQEFTVLIALFTTVKSCSEVILPSTATVYRYIDSDQTELSNTDLPRKLDQRLKYAGKHHNRTNKRILDQSIEVRLAEVEGCQVMGLWKVDLVKGNVSKVSQHYLTSTERDSRFEIAIKLPNYLAYRGYGTSLMTMTEYFKSVTFDNGSEFAKLS